MDSNFMTRSIRLERGIEQFSSQQLGGGILQDANGRRKIAG
jgi:hypothetical protein